MDQQIAEKVENFFTSFRKAIYDKGEVLIQAGDKPEYIFYLCDGRVKQYDISERGDEVVLNVFREKTFFPMSYAINRSDNKYFFEAETDVEVYKVPPDKAVKFVKDNQDVLYDLLSRVYRGTDGLLGRIAHLMASSAKSRVLYELLIESRRFGKEGELGIAITLNESEIGSRAGLTRETVNRELHKLKTEGIITIIDGRIFIKDNAELQKRIGREL